MGSLPSFLARLEIVVWSGARQFKSSSDKRDWRKPSVWRSRRWKTMPTVRTVSIAWSEYLCCLPGFRFPCAGVPYPRSSSSEIHTVRLPRCRRPASYSGQFADL